MKPKLDAPTTEDVVALLDPVIAGVLEESVAFNVFTASVVLHALIQLGARYFYLSGGTKKAATRACLDALKAARKEAEDLQDFESVTQPVAQA